MFHLNKHYWCVTCRISIDERCVDNSAHTRYNPPKLKSRSRLAGRYTQTLGTNVASLLWLHWSPVLPYNVCLFFNLAKLQCKQTVVTYFCIGFVNKIHIIGKGMIKEGTVSVAVYGYRTHWFRRRIRLYNQNEAYNSVAVYGYGTNSPWNGSVAVQNRPLLMYESSQSFICAEELRIDCFPDLCKLVVHYLHYIYN